MSRRPDRRAIKLTDEQLDQAVVIQPQDIEAAKIAWEKDAPPRFKGLLSAEPEMEI